MKVYEPDWDSPEGRMFVSRILFFMQISAFLLIFAGVAVCIVMWVL